MQPTFLNSNRDPFPRFDFEAQAGAKNLRKRKHSSSSTEARSSTVTVRRKETNLFHALNNRSTGGKHAPIAQYLETRRKYGKMDPCRKDTFNNGMQRLPPFNLNIADFRVTMGKTNLYFHNEIGELVCFDIQEGRQKWTHSIRDRSYLHYVHGVSELDANRLLAAGFDRDQNEAVLQIIGFDDDGAYKVRERCGKDLNPFWTIAVGNTIFTKMMYCFAQMDEAFSTLATHAIPEKRLNDRRYTNFKVFTDEFVAHDDQTIVICNKNPEVKSEVYALRARNAQITAIWVDHFKIVCGLRRCYTAPAACCVIRREKDSAIKFINASAVFSLETNPKYRAEREREKHCKRKYQWIEAEHRTLITGNTTSIDVVAGNIAYLGDSTGIVASVDLTEKDSSSCVTKHDRSVDFISISNQIMATADQQLIILSDLIRNVSYKKIPVLNHRYETYDWTMRSCTLFDAGLIVTLTNNMQGYLVSWRFQTFLPEFLDHQEDFQQGGIAIRSPEPSTSFMDDV